MLWTYLWFAQFMLYWYANVPEEVNYFYGRFEYYRWTFHTKKLAPITKIRVLAI
jgi:hypothetical protein